MVSKSELVDVLVDAGMTATDAEKFVNMAYEKWKELKPDHEDYMIWELVKTSVKIQARKMRRYGGERYEVLVFGVAPKRDMFGRLKRIAMAEYNKNANDAVMNGYVKIDEITGEVVPLDFRKELRDGRPNPNYGQPLPTRMVQDAYVVAWDLKTRTQKVYVLSGDLPELKVGKRYLVTARENNEMYLEYVPIGFEEAGVEDPETFYDIIDNALSEGGYYFSIGDLDEVKSYTNVIIKGIVMDFTETSRGAILVLEDIDEPIGGGVTVFCDFVPEGVDVASEVIVVGTVRNRDNEITISAISAIPNPAKKIDELIEIFDIDLSDAE